MENKIIDINKPLIKSDSGLLISAEAQETKQSNLTFEKYKERYNKAITAPIPNIKIGYSFVLTRATPPLMKGTSESGLIINQVDVDVRMAKKLAIMSENLSDSQEILMVGPHVDNWNTGDIATINYDRYRRLTDDHQAGVIETQYEIPLYVIDDYEYLLIDARDIIYTSPKKETNE